MTPTEIVTADSQKRGLNPKVILASLKKLTDNKQGFILHQNDSVLYAHYIAPGDIELHLFTEDSPLHLMHSLRYFIDKIRSSDLKAVYGKADNEGIVRFLQKAGVDIKPSDKPKYNWMALI